jgi:hypothetical protein
MTEAKGPAEAPKRPRIILPQDLEPSYANLVRIAHTPSEVMFDFARLLNALSENLAKYEAQFGEIVIPQKQSLADFLFRPPGKEDDAEE